MASVFVFCICMDCFVLMWYYGQARGQKSHINAELFSFRPLVTKLRDIRFNIHKIWLNDMHLKLLSLNGRPLCSGREE